jgi:hypothetical protein
MSIKAKPVLDDKFWIIEDNGIRIGTLVKEEDSFVLTQKGKVNLFNNRSQLVSQFGSDFLVAKITPPERKETDLFVHGYPTRVVPSNQMFDIRKKLPLFTKSENSRSVYCAGYYLIKFNVTWLKAFCPKLTTLEGNEYRGPFKTELEMKAMLKLCQ